MIALVFTPKSDCRGSQPGPDLPWWRYLTAWGLLVLMCLGGFLWVGERWLP